jgi:hypothetical protein
MLALLKTSRSTARTNFSCPGNHWSPGGWPDGATTKPFHFDRLLLHWKLISMGPLPPAPCSDRISGHRFRLL